jgi:Tfp pilus assembly protein PilV
MMKRTCGFALPEVLVAIALLVGAVVTLALVVAKAGAANTSATRATLAALMASDKLEELRSVPFDDASLAPSAPDALTADRDGCFDEPVPGWRRRWSIVGLPSSPTEAIVIAVAVSWSGAPQAVFTTVKTKRTS